MEELAGLLFVLALGLTGWLGQAHAEGQGFRFWKSR